jgi:hypothetical protein
MSETRARIVVSVKEVKACAGDERVALRAQVLKTWTFQDGREKGQAACLVGDRSGVMHIDIPQEEDVAVGMSYLFDGLRVLVYPGGWHSLDADTSTRILPLDEAVPVSAEPAYIERVYKILTGVRRKRARREAQSAGEAES